MEDTPPSSTNRGPWIIGGAVILAALIIVGYFIYENRQDQNCEEWQSLVRSLHEETGLSTFQVANVLDDPDLGDPGDFRRPSGCPNP